MEQNTSEKRLPTQEEWRHMPKGEQVRVLVQHYGLPKHMRRFRDDTPLDLLVALSDVRLERLRQDRMWGAKRDLDPYEWLTILAEEVGEVARAAMDVKSAKKGNPLHLMYQLYQELIQVAAVATAFAESVWREREALRDLDDEEPLLKGYIRASDPEERDERLPLP